MKSWLAYTAGSCLLLSVATVVGAISCASSTHNGADDDTDGGWPGDSGDNGDMLVIPPTDTGQLGLEGGGAAATGNCTTLKHMCSANCTDFPSAPVIDATDSGAPATPANAASYFTAADGSGPGPCIVDPTAGTLIPQNWLRPRFRVIPAAGQDLFQITLTSTRQANPYVIYTSSPIWTMPKTVWDALRGDSWGDEVQVLIRGVNTSGGAPSSSTSSFTIAPAAAGGSMIYWAATGDQNGLSWLEGFAPGNESVATTLEVGQVKANLYRDQGGNATDGGTAECIGCHAAVPDGNSVTFADFYPWPGSTAMVEPNFTGDVPSWLTPSGGLALSMPWLGLATFSKTDWLTEKVAITSFGCGTPDAGWTGPYPWGPSCSTQPNGSLLWIDLAANAAGPEAGSSSYNLGNDLSADFGTSFGFLARTNDPNGVEFPNWSHDGSTVVYVSTNVGQDGRLAGMKYPADGGGPPAKGEADLYTVPFNAKKGGTATPVQGASDPTVNEYYPSFSEDDSLIAFDRAVTDGPNGMYYNPYAEVYVVPASGAAAPTRVLANDPPSCQGTPGSPGVTNSWPKWSPDVESCPDGNTYYWLVFSSTREGLPFDLKSADGGQNFKMGVADGPTSQLYMTGITVAGGNITTHPGLYLWNQPTTSASSGGSAQSNHTPIWEVVNIPLPPPPTQPK
jgi:hypothetical protein